MAATGMPLFYTDRRASNASSFITTAANFVSDSKPHCNMASRSEQNPNAPQQPRPSISSQTTAANNASADGGFQFIVGGSLKELKSKKNMTVVRKKAMRSYLANNDKDSRRKSVVSEQQRHRSEDSTGPSSSIGTQDPAIIDFTKDSSTVRNGREAEIKSTQSSMIRPPTLQLARHTSSPEAHGPAMAKIEQRLMKMELELIEPPREGVRPYDVQNPPLFVSFGEGVDPFRTMFQSSYPRVSVERMKFLCARFFGTKAMGMHWIPTVLSAPHTFLSTLCCASAHLDAVLERDIESVETSLLRQEVMHLIGQGMAHPGQQANDLNVTALIQLIVSEVIGRERLSLSIHEDGLEKMIGVRGGLEKLGMNGYLASTCSWVLLESAILREEIPRRIFVDYCTSRSTKRYPPTAVLPESPLYRPRLRFDTLRNSRCCQKQILDLLDDIHSMIDLFLHPQTSRRGSRNLQSYYRDITTKYLPISKDQKPTQNDYKYEAIRITAMLKATAMVNNITLSQALPLTAKLVLGSANRFASSSRSMDSPVSPLSPMDTRHNSLTSSVMPSSYATAITVQPLDSYFDGLRTSIPSVTNTHQSTAASIQHPSFSSVPTSHSSMSSDISRPSFSSMATSHSSVTSNPDSHLSLMVSRSRPSVLSTITPPGDYNHLFADYIAGPEHTASTHLLIHLKAILDASNLSEAWLDMAGMLLWVGITFGAASCNVGNKVLEKWYSALSMRASTLLSFQHPEPIHSTMLKMTQIVDALREPPSPGRANPTMAGTGKKRRMQD